jgi:hypothetical protein
MSRIAKLRVFTLTCVLCFSLSTIAQSALAEVLISVNKSTQQMSVSVDGILAIILRFRLVVLDTERQMVATVRSVWLHLGSRSS